MFRLLFLLFLFFSSLSGLSAQTCCSGGVPLSSNLGLPAAEAKNLQFSLNYDLNILHTLKEGISTIEDQTRNRKTHSLLAQVGYSFTRRLSADVMFSYVRQERTISSDQSRNFAETEGPGDLVLLLKYRVWESKNHSSNWTLGAGTKLATGPADRTSNIGLLYNADLQPGTGATDAIFWTQFTQTGVLRPTMGFFATLTHNRRGTNDDYLPVFDPGSGTTRTQSYQFGNEWQLITGISDRLLIGALMVDPGLSFRFRSVKFDRINEQRVPSTGGTWWFLNPNLTFWGNERFSVNLNVEVPLYANVIGTQLSPSFRLNAGVFYRLPLKKEKINPVLENPMF